MPDPPLPPVEGLGCPAILPYPVKGELGCCVVAVGVLVFGPSICRCSPDPTLPVGVHVTYGAPPPTKEQSDAGFG